MRKAIWKFPLNLLNVQQVSMPTGARVLSVQLQGDTICLWAEVDPKAEQQPRDFYIVGTGHEYNPRGLEYRGTVQTGVYVWHVFEGQGS